MPTQQTNDNPAFIEYWKDYITGDLQSLNKVIILPVAAYKVELQRTFEAGQATKSNAKPVNMPVASAPKPANSNLARQIFDTIIFNAIKFQAEGKTWYQIPQDRLLKIKKELGID